MRRLPQAVDGRAGDEDLAVLRHRDADPGERPPRGPEVAGLRDGDRGARLREAVARADAEAGVVGALEQRPGHRAAPEQDAPQRRARLGAGVQQPLELGGDQGGHGDAAVAQEPRDGVRVERRRREHDGGRHEHGAHDAHEAADVRQRQRAQPALLPLPEAERALDAAGVREQVPVGQRDQHRPAGRAGRRDDEGDVLAGGRRRQLEDAALPPHRLLDHHLGLPDEQEPLADAQARVHGDHRRAQQQAAVQDLGEGRARLEREGDPRPAADRPAVQRARRPHRAQEQLAVGDRLAGRLHGDPVRAPAHGARQPVSEVHVRAG